MRFKYRTFELYGLGMYGHDANLIPNATDTGYEPQRPVTFTGGFVQAQYWIYPWLMPLVRYDFVNSPADFQSGLSRYDTRNRVSPGIQLLVRANLKVAFEYQYRWETPNPGPPPLFFRANGFLTGVDFAF
jgi:hypothetical protein